MSGSSYSVACFKCGGQETLNISADWKPYDTSSGECLECGFSFYTKEEQMSLKEVNEQRLEIDLEPLTELKKQGREGGK